MMKTIDLYERCIKESKVIPPFINPRSKEHHDAYIVISELIVSLSFLIQRNILTDKQINHFLLEFEEMASEMDHINSLTLYMSSNNYVNIKIQDYLEQAVDDEEYEVAANLRKFINFRKQFTFTSEK